jgi:hypothetical protein
VTGAGATDTAAITRNTINVTGAKATDPFQGSVEATSGNSVKPPLRRPVVQSLK